MKRKPAKPTGPRRAAKGSIGSHLLLALPDALRATMERLARDEGNISLGEWIRRACLEAVERSTRRAR